MKKILFTTIIVLLFLNSIASSSAYYNAPANTTTNYQLIEDNNEVYDYFKYLELYDVLSVHIIDVSLGTVRAEITSNRTFYQLEDDISNGWTAQSCFPFVIDTSYLNDSLDQTIFYVVSTQIEEICGASRQTTTIRQEKIIGDNIFVYYYYKYDTETGILDNWWIEHISDGYIFININITSTNAWSIPEAPFNWWIVLLAVGSPILVFIVIITIYYAKNKKEKNN